MDMYSTFGLYGWIDTRTVSYRALQFPHFVYSFTHKIQTSNNDNELNASVYVLCFAFSAVINCTVHGMNVLFDCLCVRVPECVANAKTCESLFHHSV